MWHKNTITLFVFIIIFPGSNKNFSQSGTIKAIEKIAGAERTGYEKRTMRHARAQASPNFQVSYYRCHWNIDPGVRYISGSVTSYLKTTANTSSITYDFTQHLTVDSVIYHHQPVVFLQQSNNTLVINFPGEINKGQLDSVAVYYHGVPPSSGDFTGGFAQTTHKGRPVIWTLSEPYGASGWWPCRNGLDDKADSIDIYITHPAGYKAASVGVNVYTQENGRTVTAFYKHRYPIASYLVAFAVTNFTVLTSSVIIDDKNMLILQYVYPESLSAFQGSIPLLRDALQVFSYYFGSYPFVNEKYAQTQFSWGGGMEHQTNSFISNPVDDIVLHELSHQWFGDKITCGSWQDIWLNEGFATWMADMFYPEIMDSAILKTNVATDLSLVVALPDGSVWVDDTSNTRRIFDTRLSYAKGAFLVRMLRFTLGDSLFFEGIYQYLNDPLLAYGFARTADLQRNLQQVSGQNLDYFFNQWFYGEGYPSFTVKWRNSSSGKLYFTVSQKTSKPASVGFFRVALPVRLSNGSQTNNKTVVLHCEYNNQEFEVDDPGFRVASVAIDPDKYFISKKNKVVKQSSRAQSKVAETPDP